MENLFLVYEPSDLTDHKMSRQHDTSDLRINDESFGDVAMMQSIKKYKKLQTLQGNDRLNG